MKSKLIALVVLLLTGCAVEQKTLFFSWGFEKGDWTANKLNGIQFMAPASLPCMMVRNDLAVLCVSGYKSDGYFPGPYVPSEAVYISNSDKEQGSDAVTVFSEYVTNGYGVIKKTADPIPGYSYWMLGEWGNSDNSRAVDQNTTVNDVDWGYLFKTKKQRICRVWLQKMCNVPYGQLDVNRLYTPNEMRLVKEIAVQIAADN